MGWYRKHSKTFDREVNPKGGLHSKLIGKMVKTNGRIPFIIMVKVMVQRFPLSANRSVNTSASTRNLNWRVKPHIAASVQKPLITDRVNGQ